jgi:predicted flavoprotein YhiN
MLAPNSRRDDATLLQLLRAFLPARLSERWLTLHTPTGWTNRDLAALERELHAWAVVPAGTEGFVKAEVTVGGVDTRDLDARTMEARAVPGLYFVGEVVDVTGWLGGYNFQWAWASGYSAGQVA